MLLLKILIKTLLLKLYENIPQNVCAHASFPHVDNWRVFATMLNSILSFALLCSFVNHRNSSKHNANIISQILNGFEEGNWYKEVNIQTETVEKLHFWEKFRNPRGREHELFKVKMDFGPLLVFFDHATMSFVTSRAAQEYWHRYRYYIFECFWTLIQGSCEQY